MKQKDLGVIAIVVIVSVIFSMYLSSKLFSTPASQAQQVVTVSAISPAFNDPGKTYYNYIDPSQLIGLGINTNNSPFQATQ